MNKYFGWMRVGLTDLRGDMRRFGVLIACLALGTGVIAAVGSVGAGFVVAVERDATTMMGGDLEASRPDRDATEAELAFLQTFGEVTHVVDTNSRGANGEYSAFLDLRAVGENFPLRGDVGSPQLANGAKPGTLVEARDGTFGAIIDPVLVDRLNADLGDVFNIGETQFEVRGLLTSMPDSAVRGFQLGLTVLISDAALATMTDLRAPLPGMLTQHRYKIELSELTYDEAAPLIAAHFNDEDWSTQSPRDAAGDLVRFYDLFSRFLMIVGLSSLLVGGVGVSNGVSAYIGERQRSIATLRSLGATSSRILVHFLTQIGVLTAIGVTLGVMLGVVASWLILPLVGQIININLPALINAKSLLTAAGFGVLAGFAFSYLPLMRAQKVSPALLFRTLGSAVPELHWRAFTQASVLLPIILAGLGMFWLAVLTTNNIRLVLVYTVGAIGAFLLLRGAGWLLQAGVRAIPPVPAASVRNAMRNIHGPGSTAPMVIVSIGLGLAMLLVISLLDSNLQNQLVGAVSQNAPTFVATDLFPDEVETLEQLAETEPELEDFKWSPILRAVVTQVGGVNTDDLGELSGEAAFLLSEELPVTWLADLPADTTNIEGEWWPSDYDGPPLISLRSTIKAELGLEVGDTIQFMVFGDLVDAKIASFREYKWQNGLNFMVTFSPGLIQNYPSNSLGTIKATEGHEKDIERLLAREFPEVSFIPIGDALNLVADILGQLGNAVNVVGGLAVANGLLVLAGTMAAGRKQREADAVIQKVLGATRSEVLWIFIIEYCLLGAFAALIASMVGISSAWLITETLMDVEFGVDVTLIISVIVGAVLLTVATGAATTWKALSSRPAQVLRNA